MWTAWALLLGEIHAGMHDHLINDYKSLDGGGRAFEAVPPIPAKGIGKDVIRFPMGGYFKGGDTLWQE